MIEPLILYLNQLYELLPRILASFHTTNSMQRFPALGKDYYFSGFGFTNQTLSTGAGPDNISLFTV